MTNNENQYTIYIRSTKESIPVSKEEFDAYYHDINLYRQRQQHHGKCVCPANKRLDCDMDCESCPFRRAGDFRSLDITTTDDDGNETSWIDSIADTSPQIDDLIAYNEESASLRITTALIFGSLPTRRVSLTASSATRFILPSSPRKMPLPSVTSSITTSVTVALVPLPNSRNSSPEMVWSASLPRSALTASSFSPRLLKSSSSRQKLPLPNERRWR